MKTLVAVVAPCLHLAAVAALGGVALPLSLVSRRWRLVRRIIFAYVRAALREFRVRKGP